LEDPSVGGRIILKWLFENWNNRAWAGSIWLRIGTGGGLWGISCLAENLLVSEEGLCCM
jgi:hypothetical protein